MEDGGIVRRAFRDSIPVLMGYVAMGFASGVLLAVEGGISCAPAWAAATSATFVSGPLQYIFVDWVRTSQALGSVLLVTLCVNFRYSLYGLSLIDRLKGASLWQKAYIIGTITDETYALQTACRLEGRSGVAYCLFLAMFDHLYWIGGVTAGAIAGVLAQGAFSTERVAAVTKGIDFAMTALFLVILTDQVRERANRLPAAIGFVAALIAFFAFGRANMLVPAVAGIVATFFACRRWMDVR
ncbi:MAG: AzlC family ABC transporter permease [Kiritimatiellae bacterium]|nr:AzlC family ABC transporter permease [Kiritimatiellia bacterium]